MLFSDVQIVVIRLAVSANTAIFAVLVTVLRPKDRHFYLSP